MWYLCHTLCICLCVYHYLVCTHHTCSLHVCESLCILLLCYAEKWWKFIPIPNSCDPKNTLNACWVFFNCIHCLWKLLSKKDYIQIAPGESHTRMDIPNCVFLIYNALALLNLVIICWQQYVLFNTCTKIILYTINSKMHVVYIFIWLFYPT